MVVGLICILVGGAISIPGFKLMKHAGKTKSACSAQTVAIVTNIDQREMQDIGEEGFYDTSIVRIAEIEYSVGGKP